MDTWHDAVLNECMATETCYVKDDPAATLKNLINWHVELERENMVSVWELVKIRDGINGVLLGRSE